MNSKDRELVHKLMEEGVVRPPSMQRKVDIQIKVDNSIPDNTWIMNEKAFRGHIQFLVNQGARVNRKKFIDIER